MQNDQSGLIHMMHGGCRDNLRPGKENKNMKKWKSKLIAVVTALCMALSVPVFAGSASVYAATQTMTDSIQFNRMDGVLKKNS